MSFDEQGRSSDVHVSCNVDTVANIARRALRHGFAVCVLGLALSACEGSNVFEPCDPDGDTPHTPCEQPTE